MSSATRPPERVAFLGDVALNIFVYSDESGVFDKIHNDIFVFAGVILIGKEAHEEWSRRYSAVERSIRMSKGVAKGFELKATQIENKEKGKLFRSLNNCYKFGVVINQKKVLDRIYVSKKDKQRYLDYAYKIAIKRAFESMIEKQCFSVNQIERLYFRVDEHTTATNGCYELREGLEQEFKNGTYNRTFDKFFPPIFPNIKSVELEFCNSSTKLLIRAADIIANRIYYLALNDEKEKLRELPNTNIIYLP